MGERSKVHDFLDVYRAAFEAFDVSAIADLFAYPCQITSDAGEIEVAVVPTHEAWASQMERLVAAYRKIGVRSAEAGELRVTELTPNLAQARQLAPDRWGGSHALRLRCHVHPGGSRARRANHSHRAQ